MQIKVIGRWQDGKPLKCPACIEFRKILRQAMDESGLADIPIEECASEEEYNSYGIILTPALVIDGKVKVSGRVVPKEMVKEFLRFEGSIKNPMKTTETQKHRRTEALKEEFRKSS